MFDTYQEKINRYRIVYHEELPDRHKAEMRLNGIDPDTRRCLKWSFEELADAEEQLKIEQENAPEWQTYYLIDAGEAEVVERPAWF